MMESLTAERSVTFFNGAITKLGTHLHSLQWPNSFTLHFSPKFHHILSWMTMQKKKVLHKALRDHLNV